LAELNDRWQSVIETLRRVNGWDDTRARADIQQSRTRYRMLCGMDWDLDLRLLTGWVTLDAYPELVIPAEA
jgi:hypothetical protein